MKSLHAQIAPSEPATRRLGRLTPREHQVAIALGLGGSNAEIAAELGVSIKTIDTHRLHVLQKLELRNNVALVRFLIGQRVIATPEPEVEASVAPAPPEGYQPATAANVSAQ